MMKKSPILLKASLLVTSAVAAMALAPAAYAEPVKAELALNNVITMKADEKIATHRHYDVADNKYDDDDYDDDKKKHRHWDRYRDRDRRDYRHRDYRDRDRHDYRRRTYRHRDYRSRHYTPWRSDRYRHYTNYRRGYNGYYTPYRSRLGISFHFGTPGYSRYRWSPTNYSFYRPTYGSYDSYRNRTQCRRVTMEGWHHGHRELVSVKLCSNPWDGEYIVQGSERVINCPY